MNNSVPVSNGAWEFPASVDTPAYSDSEMLRKLAELEATVSKLEETVNQLKDKVKPSESFNIL